MTIQIEASSRVPWHGIMAPAETRSYTDGHDLAEALGMDWVVEPRTLVNLRGDVAAPIPYRGVFRSDNNECVGTVGRQWHAIQNHQLCQLVVDLSASAPISLVGGGTLGRGEKVWVMADLGTRRIGNRTLRDGSPDELNQYLIFVTAHNGSGAAKIIPVPNQLHCSNALAGIIRHRGRYGWGIMHTRSAECRLQQARGGLLNTVKWFAELAAELEELETQPFTTRDMHAFAEKMIGEMRQTLGDAREITDRAAAAREEDRLTLVRLFNEGASCTGRTKVDALNAVTEFISHHRRRARKGGDQMRAALSRLEDEWYGSRPIKTRQRALELLQVR